MSREEDSNYEMHNNNMDQYDMSTEATFSEQPVASGSRMLDFTSSAQKKLTGFLKKMPSFYSNATPIKTEPPDDFPSVPNSPDTFETPPLTPPEILDDATTSSPEASSTALLDTQVASTSAAMTSPFSIKQEPEDFGYENPPPANHQPQNVGSFMGDATKKPNVGLESHNKNVGKKALSPSNSSRPTSVTIKRAGKGSHFGAMTTPRRKHTKSTALVSLPDDIDELPPLEQPIHVQLAVDPPLIDSQPIDLPIAPPNEPTPTPSVLLSNHILKAPKVSHSQTRATPTSKRKSQGRKIQTTPVPDTTPVPTLGITVQPEITPTPATSPTVQPETTPVPTPVTLATVQPETTPVLPTPVTSPTVEPQTTQVPETVVPQPIMPQTHQSMTQPIPLPAPSPLLPGLFKIPARSIKNEDGGGIRDAVNPTHQSRSVNSPSRGLNMNDNFLVSNFNSITLPPRQTASTANKPLSSPPPQSLDPLYTTQRATSNVFTKVVKKQPMDDDSSNIFSKVVQPMDETTPLPPTVKQESGGAEGGIQPRSSEQIRNHDNMESIDSDVVRAKKKTHKGKRRNKNGN